MVPEQSHDGSDADIKEILSSPKKNYPCWPLGKRGRGLNGSRAFVEDHPEIVKNIQAVFNQDNGTGRVVNISGQGFLNAYDYVGRWLSEVPDSFCRQIETNFPGSPAVAGQTLLHL